MTAEERYAQHCRRIGIWGRSAMRKIHDGINEIDGDWDRRSILREFDLAYQNGFRDGQKADAP